MYKTETRKQTWNKFLNVFRTVMDWWTDGCCKNSFPLPSTWRKILSFEIFHFLSVYKVLVWNASGLLTEEKCQWSYFSTLKTSLTTHWALCSSSVNGPRMSSHWPKPTINVQISTGIKDFIFFALPNCRPAVFPGEGRKKPRRDFYDTVTFHWNPDLMTHLWGFLRQGWWPPAIIPGN